MSGEPLDPRTFRHVLGQFCTGITIITTIDGDVPIGVGLSSSAAVECAIALALDDLWRLGLERPELALAARLAESEFVGGPTGIMDQTASLLGT